ncbi:hypothetical protein Dsin_008570 [Dipteronia sinensis]|uniref:Receptor ligand binding region domain-containing protein n=1 Tax=Dipteronia sinensis TaxID=43782 RepID=A0AAE0ECM3_9ROSI|nr:hypothetical protein Dsin_008570 [Dipteronia sinensis]
MSHPIILFYLPLFLVFFHVRVMSENLADHTQPKSIVHIGAVFDVDSPEGAIVETCMSMAISDFYALHPHHRTRLVLETKTTKNIVSTAAAVVDLVKNVKVHAILGPQIPDAAPLVVEMGAKAHVPCPTSLKFLSPPLVMA